MDDAPRAAWNGFVMPFSLNIYIMYSLELQPIFRNEVGRMKPTPPQTNMEVVEVDESYYGCRIRYHRQECT